MSAIKLLVKSSVGPNDLELFLLVEYVKKAAQIYHDLIPKTIRELAFKLAGSNKLKMLTKGFGVRAEIWIVISALCAPLFRLWDHNFRYQNQSQARRLT